MSDSVAIIYHTSEGHSAEVAERVAGRVRAGGLTVDLFAVQTAPATLHGHAAAIIGGPIHLGHHDKLLEGYVRNHVQELGSMPSAFFSVSLTASDPSPEAQATAGAVVHDLLDRAGWEPDMVALFGGALAYTKYGFIKRQLIKRIAAKEGGQTDTSRDWDRTDWAAVDAFADDFATHVVGVREAAPPPP
ncbi:MAG: flavodoxin domain-containing protein [Dehalococcoidia bacterium]